MEMKQAIQDFAKQFAFEPHVENAGKVKSPKKFVVAGMGGSHLAADLIKVWNPSCDIVIHSNYGLPPLSDLKDRLIICSSYSGNTEEVLSTFESAGKEGLNRAAIFTGAKLMEMAKNESVPYVLMPNTDIQPRSALGLSFKGILKLMGEETAVNEATALTNTLHPEEYENEGKELAEKIRNHIPVIYASEKNQGIAYVWKIKINETGKTPAFYNILPELNHNEMTSFDTKTSDFHFILLQDADDHPRIIRRMEVLEELYTKRGFPVEKKIMGTGTIFHKIFGSVLLADWTALYTAQIYGYDPDEVPMVEELKKLIAK